MLWGVLLEAKTAGDAVGVVLQKLADVAVDDLVLAIDYACLDQRLAVEPAGKEVLQVPVRQRLILRALLQWRNPEFPALHLEFIIFHPPPTSSKHPSSKGEYLRGGKIDKQFDLI